MLWLAVFGRSNWLGRWSAGARKNAAMGEKSASLTKMVQQLRHSHRRLCCLWATPEYQSGARRRILARILGWLLKLLLPVGKNTAEDVGGLFYLAAGRFHIPNKTGPGARIKHKFGKSTHNHDGYSYVLWNMQTAVKKARFMFALLLHRGKGSRKLLGSGVYVNIIQ